MVQEERSITLRSKLTVSRYQIPSQRVSSTKKPTTQPVRGEGVGVGVLVRRGGGDVTLGVGGLARGESGWNDSDSRRGGSSRRMLWVAS